MILIKLLEDDITKFLEDKPRTESYRKLCSNLLRPFQKWLGNRDLTEGWVKRYVRERYKEPSSLNTTLAVMKSFCDWKKKRLPQDDMATYIRDRAELELIQGIRREKVTKRIEKKGLTLEELGSVLRKYPVDSLEFSVVWLLFWFGTRPGELVTLLKRMVNFRTSKVVFETEKTKVEREVYFDRFTAEHLKRFLDAKPPYSFVYKACKAVGIVPKAGRQSFISHMQRKLGTADFDPVRLDLIVKSAVGHTTSDITAIYTDLPHDIERAFREFHYMVELEGSLQR